MLLLISFLLKNPPLNLVTRRERIAISVQFTGVLAGFSGLMWLIHHLAVIGVL